MSLPAGARVGHYEIASLLGVGGMGEVYRATDTNLKRQVAIKVLPESVARDGDRLARFQREAEVLASLNHPGIAAIYGVERASGMMALAMELVEGPTLSERLARGPIPVAEALPIAEQIAGALEAAHEQGIIHRDLKPANIKVRDDGTVKVLDFGLAKMADPANRSSASGVDVTNSPTLTSPAFTHAGMILGTAAYMSPEQASGKAVDKRSDIWAFGVVLLEMLTARRVFDGETTSHVLASVLKDAPDFTALPPETPAPIRRLLQRCLEKDRRKRLADAADARLDIEDARREPSAAIASATQSAPAVALPRSRPRVSIASAVAGLVAGAAIAGAAALFLANRGTMTSSEPERALTYTPLSFEPGGNNFPVWSPDGKGVAFAARQSEDDPLQVYVRYLNASTSTQMTQTVVQARPIAWTRTGRIVFVSSAPPAGLWTISQTGGPPEPLFAIANDREAATADVSPDGSVIAYYGERDGKFGVWISAPAGAPPRRYEPSPAEATTVLNGPLVRFSPDGRQLLLLRNAGRGEEAWVMPYPPDVSHPPRQIFPKGVNSSVTGTPRASWFPDNRRIAVSMSPGTDADRLYVMDTTKPGLAPLSSGTTAETFPAVSPDGSHVAFVERTDDWNVLQVHVTTGEVSPLLTTRRNEDMPAWSMNSPIMAYVTDRTGQPEIWVHEPGRPDRPVVTPRDFPSGTTSYFIGPILSPDGTRLIYQRVVTDVSDAKGRDVMWLSSLNGGAPVRVTNADTLAGESPGAWSPDGNWVVYWHTEGTATSVKRVRTSGQASPETLAPPADWVGLPPSPPSWSPTGDVILYWDNGWRLVSPETGDRRDLALKANVCGFSRDATQLYCVRPEGARGVLFARAIAGGPERIIARLSVSQLPFPALAPSTRLTLTPDGQHVTYGAVKRESGLWLLNGLH